MLGRLKMVENINAKFGADPWFFFVKVQGVVGHEEYWLLTEEESVRFEERGVANPEDAPPARRGLIVWRENTMARFGAAPEYHVIQVSPPGRPHERVIWMLTDSDIEQIRDRVSKNREDIEANREGWLADLLD